VVSAETRKIALLPGIASALSFSAADVLGKIVFNDGMDVLSFVTARGLLTTLFFWLWLRLAPPARRHTRRERMVGGFKWSSQQDLLAYRLTRQTDPAFAHREARDLAS